MHRESEVASALAAAREALPGWVPWLPALIAAVYGAVVLGFVFPLLSARIAAGPFLQAPADLHWTDRAARSWPGRMIAGINLMLFPMVAAITARTLGGPLSALSKGQLGWLGVFCALPGLLFIKLWIDRRSFPRPIAMADSFRDGAVILLVLYPILPLYLAVGTYMPKRFDAMAGMLIAVAALGTVLLGRGRGLRLASWLRLAGPASPRIQDIVAEAAARVGVRPRKVWSLRWSAANAVAFPGSNEVAFSSGCEAALSDAEIGAIAAHELGHLAEPRRIRLIRSASRFTFFPFMLVHPVSSLLPMGATLALCLVAPLVAFSISQRVLRRMEVRADQVAHAHEGDEGTYARALERLHEYSLIPAVSKRQSSHPSLWDRMAAAGVSPGYAKPAPPSAARIRFGFLSGLMAAIVFTFWAHRHLRIARQDWQTAPLAVLVASGGSEATLMDLGDRAWTFRDARSATPFYWAAAMVSPKSPDPARYWALAMAEADSCRRASQGLVLYRQRTESDTRITGDHHLQACAEIRDSIAGCRARMEARTRLGATPAGKPAGPAVPAGP